MQKKLRSSIIINTMKNIIYSRTFWLAIAQMAVAVVVFYQTQFPLVGELLVLKSVLDIWLRMLTTQEVVIKV